MLQILKQMIETSPNQSISYSEYMNTVLYHPVHGYYMKEKEKIGRNGDFYTSSNLSNVFGRLFARLWSSILKEGSINICEIGGGNGRFANAVLEEWKNISPDTYKNLSYTIVETSSYHQKLQYNTITDKQKIVQINDLKEIKNFEGIIFSNELFDAFPVDVIECKENCLYEVRISVNSNGELQEVFFSLENEEIFDFLTEQNITLQNGQRMEIPLAMKKYIIELSKCISKAVIFTVDYGYTYEQWREPIHFDGSLRGFYQHQLIKNPLAFPGEMDLTTHIHFDALISIGEKMGLHFVNKWRQDEFLLRAGIIQFLQENMDPNPFSEKSKQNRAIRSLVIDGGISSAFHVVVQEKNMNVQWDSLLRSYL